jgi:AcrR family transcriptional regulator
MPRKRNTKYELMDAAMRLAAKGGVQAATIRAIAHEVGVTEGAIYRHFRTKEELYLAVYARAIEEMVRRKQELVESARPLREKLQEWVRITYESFDRETESFTFVLLTPHAFAESDPEITRVQGRLFKQVISQAGAAGEMRAMAPELALTLCIGMMLNVPRQILDKELPGPASQYADVAADAMWRVLRSN